MRKFLLALVVSVLALGASTVSGLEFGSYFDALFFNSRKLREDQLPVFVDTGFGRMASSFIPDDGKAGGILEKLRAAGVKVLYEQNTGKDADHKKNYDTFTNIDMVHVADDVDLIPGNSPAKMAARIAELRQVIRPDMKTFLTFSKGAVPNVWKNSADVIGLQLYIYKEGTIRRWAWDYVKQWRAAHSGKLWVHPYLGKNSLPYGLPYINDPKWKVQEYTPLAYNEALIWAALCAGADDVLFYSAYAVNPSYYPDYYNILERDDLQPGYKALIAQVRSYERFFAGTKTTFDDGSRIVGATWTLPTGEALTVRVDTLEAKPDVTFTIVKPLAAKVTQTEKGFNVEYTP
jgi:hypothetical protein